MTRTNCPPHKNLGYATFTQLGAVLRAVEVVPGLVELEVAVPRSRPAVW